MSKSNLFEHFSMVDRAALRKTREDDAKRSKCSMQSNNYSADGETEVSTRASDLSKMSSPTMSPSKPPASPVKKRRSFLARRLSKLGIMDLKDEEENGRPTSPAPGTKDQDLLGRDSSHTISSIDLDAGLTSFELEMKAMLLLADIRERLEYQKQEEQELNGAISRTLELALARGTDIGALVAMRKVKKSRQRLRRIQAAIAYLETCEMDIMSDVEEAKRMPTSETFKWPEYDDFADEVAEILSASKSDAKSDWSDKELLEELAYLRSAQRG